jgi:class 3 adenylate cyclase/tetratricopeptide (TPR) repeat protein
MQCSQCHAENKEGRRFCARCGAPLARECPACHFANETEAEFCGGCGNALSSRAGVREPFASPKTYTPEHLAERILNVRSALEGERKQVSVLFADLRNSLELLADRDPEEARRILDPVLERMMAAVHRYEGTVNQVMGDGIMALFGAPVAHEDHAVRAGYAALKMQSLIAEYAEQVRRQQNVDVQIRIGLNAGEVVVRGIDNDLTMDYSAIGQTTHLASRMEQLAQPGAILVTENFTRLTQGALHYKPLGLVQVKGRGEPLDVYQLIDAEPTRSRFQAASARGLTRFVGREGELTTLERALARALRGQGQAVAVIGEPGMGKSRLVYEFIDSERTRGCRVLETGSVSYGTVTAYLPIRDLLKGYFQIEDRDDPMVASEQIRARLQGLGSSIPHALPALQALLDLPVSDAAWAPLDAADRRQRMLNTVKWLLVRQSQQQPLIVIFENLHWIDTETQAFLDSLVESLPTARILLLVNYRPEYQHGWGSKTYYTQVRLDPLPPETAEELLRALLGNGGELEPLKRLLIARTEGNPFFLEESIRTLVETGVVVGGRGACRLVKPLSSIQVPATVQAILAAHIDRLSAADKRLLQSAAVIGREISLPLLQAVTDLAENPLRAGLARLQAAEFIYETSLFPELEYTFKHALTLEVAYGSLLHERRRLLHAQIVDAIEELYVDHLSNEVERLAHHTFRAEAWEKAVSYYRQAGTKAASRSAYREAVACFEQALLALKALPAGPETNRRAFDLRLEMRTWLVPLGDYDRILANLQACEAIAQARGDEQGLGLVRVYMTDYFRLTGASEQAVITGEQALKFAADLGDPTLDVLAHQVLGHAYHAVGGYRRAVQLLRRNVERLRGDLMRKRFGSAGLPAVLARGYMVLSLADLGEFDEAVAIGEEAVRLAEEFDNAHSHAVVAHALGLAHLIRGDLERAIPLLEQELARCEAANIPMGSRLLPSALGYAHALAGRPDAGIPLIEDALRKAEALKVVFRYALWLAWLGEALLLAGARQEAGRVAERALRLATEHKESGHEAYILRLLGDLAASETSPDLEHAEHAYLRALDLARSLEMRPLAAHCYRGLADLYDHTDRRAEADAHRSALQPLLVSMRMTLHPARPERLRRAGS